ncbi:putative protein disulfide-isomerase A6, partial [Glycine soja]
VDCDEHKSLCSKYGVSGYPTIQWFPKGSLEPKKYKGPRTADSLAEFVNMEGRTNVKIATAPSNVVVLTSENFNEVVLDETKDVLVEFYAPCLTRMEEEVEKLKGSASRHGKIYLKATKNYLEKGSDYANNEIHRLQRILDKSISPAKVDELTLKKNILSTYAA